LHGAVDVGEPFERLQEEGVLVLIAAGHGRDAALVGVPAAEEGAEEGKRPRGPLPQEDLPSLVLQLAQEEVEFPCVSSSGGE
jgi:hypothetical protein